jgi:hypothetical protein
MEIIPTTDSMNCWRFAVEVVPAAPVMSSLIRNCRLVAVDARRRTICSTVPITAGRTPAWRCQNPFSDALDGLRVNALED